MLLDQRRTEIMTALATHDQSVKELAESLHVSQSTIRRDLTRLEQQGLLERKYGGAVLARGSHSNTTDTGEAEEPIDIDRAKDLELRRSMAKVAASLVRDNSTIILDIGSTTPLIALELRGRPITIITSSLAVLDQVRDDDAVDIILLGGVLRRNHQSLVGPLAEDAIHEMSADLMFLSCTGVKNNFVVDDMAVEAPIKRGLIRSADQTVLLAGENKFPGTGSLRLCDLDHIDTIITTSGTSESSLKNSRSGGRKVIVA
ncbi:DeoR/GlpR family DNA-binding transcription regulator [Bifidobacterium sp.]